MLGGTAVTVGNASVFGNAALKVTGNNTMGIITGGSITLLGGNGITTSQGTLSLVDGAINSLTITNRTTAANNFTVGGATSGAASILDFDIGASSGSNDTIALGTGKLVLNAGGGIINLTALSSFVAGNYNLLTYGAKSGSGAFTFDGTNATETIGADTFTLTTGATSTVLNISVASPAIAYFQGATNANWSTNMGGVVNFTSDPAGNTNLGALPGSQTNVHFYASNATLTGGVVVSNVDTSFTINSLTFDNGSAPVNITAGGGTLTINAGTFGTNTSPNGITIGSGAGAVSIAAPIILGASQTWTNSSANQLVVTGIVSGIGNQLTTVGNIQLGGLNSYTGGTVISSGTLQMNGNSTSAGNGGLGSINGALTVNGTLDLNTTSQGVGALSGSGTILNSGSSSASTFTIGNNNATGTSFSGVIEDNAGTGGTVALTKVGSGALTLTGPNTYSGGTSITGGGLIGSTTSLQGNIAASNSTTITFNQAGSGTYSGSITGGNSAAVIVTGNGSVTFSGASNSYTGGTSITGAGTTLTGTTTSLQGNIAISPSNALIFDQTITGSYAGVLSLGGTLTKNGIGSVTLSGSVANTNTGLTTVNNGTLVLGKSGVTALGGSLTITGGTVQLAGTGGNQIADTAAVTVNGTLDLNGTMGTASGTLGGLGEIVGAVTGSGTITNTSVTSNATLAMGKGLTGVQTEQFDGTITDGTSKSTAILTNSTTTFTGNNSYSGGTIVFFKSITAASASGNALGSGDVIFATGSAAGTAGNGLILSNNTTTGALVTGVANASGSHFYGGDISLGSSTLTFGNNGNSGSFAGEITGTGNLIKTGGGTQTFTTGTQGGELVHGTVYTAYSGTTVIQGGSLVVTESSYLANTSSITVGDTAAHSSASLDVSGMTGGGMTLGATQSLGGHGTVIGNITAAVGTTFTPGGSIGTLTITGDDDLSAGGNVFNYTLAASSGSVIAVSGVLALNATTDTYTVNLIDNAGANGQGSLGTGTYTLFTYGSDSNFSAGAFDVASGLPEGDTYAVIDDTVGKEIDLVISSPVPEPASLAMLGLGVAVLLRRRRRV